MAFLGDKNVGDVVKISENGVAQNFIIVHKGKPSSIYDNSCDGVWVLREKAHSARAVDAENSNDYENSDIVPWLNGEYLNSIDPKIREAIKQVKIPYKKGQGNAAAGVQTGANGLSCKIFLLSGYEVGFTTTDNQYFPVDGARLSYFLNGNSDANAKAKRICTDAAGSAVFWWLRSPYTHNTNSVWYVFSDGTYYSNYANTAARWARPAFVLPSYLLVNSDGTVSTNTLPTITSDKTGDLGTLENGFECAYSVNDADAADEVTVTITLDGVQKSEFTAEKGAEYTYSLTGNDWLKITNGNHAFKIEASDGKDTVESTATFTRSVNTATVTLNTPLEADDVIRACFLKIDGSLPTDTELVCEVTNNGNDAEPAWEDCSIKVKSGLSYAFKNKSAENGFAFNFRISAKRGASNAGGYITQISGGFE